MKDKSESGSMITTVVSGILSVSALLFILGCLLLNKIHAPYAMEQLGWSTGAVAVLFLTVAVGCRKWLKAAYPLALFACSMTFTLSFHPSEVFLRNIAPAVMTLIPGLAAAKVCTESGPSFLGKHSQQILSGVLILIIFSLLFIPMFPKGALAALATTVFVLLFVNKIFNRTALAIGGAAVAGFFAYGLMRRGIPAHNCFMQKILQMIKEGGWSGCADPSCKVLENIQGTATELFYAAAAHFYGLRSICLLLVLFGIFFALSLLAAVKVKEAASRNVILSMSVLLFVQALCGFLVNFQLIRGAFFAAVPFMSYGIANLFASTVAVGLICSAIIEDLEKNKGDKQ